MKLIRYLCQKCYDAECKRLGVDDMEVYTGSIVFSLPCSLCGEPSQYSVPGYDRPEGENHAVL